ncbi:MAG: hypothetical protein WD512_14005 [Candidatus Paceibacterota bacterium]
MQATETVNNLYPLEKALNDYKRDYALIYPILEASKGLISKWSIPNKKSDFIIISNSTKKQGYIQLTYFDSFGPAYDLQRKTLKEIAQELTFMRASIHTINYIF